MVEATGTVNITLEGPLANAKARTSMDGLFKDVNVSRGRQMQMAEDL
jgi:hypothetical protein